MSDSPPLEGDVHDYELELTTLISALEADPERVAVASEIEVLRSIYEPTAIHVWHIPEGSERSTNPSTVRYAVTLTLPERPETPLTVLVSLLPTYPESAPPQLQLLTRYVGPFGVDASLFGAVLRTFISKDGVEWAPGAVCVFDGLQSVAERCGRWYEERLSTDAAGRMVREDERDEQRPQAEDMETEGTHTTGSADAAVPLPAEMPSNVQIVEAEAITDRKSAFVGRACRISDPSQVPLVLAHLMSDRRIARAAHPIINAWRCEIGGILHQDNDDDGETAAGGRLAHLLQILDVNNVLCVVTRYFGGIHLGPDRFKHINQAARNALELGGFLDVPGQGAAADGRKGAARAKKRA